MSHSFVSHPRFTLVGKSCYVLYAYSGGGQDELTIVEQEIVSVIDASDKDWVRAQNGEGERPGPYEPGKFVLSNSFCSQVYSDTFPLPICRRCLRRQTSTPP